MQSGKEHGRVSGPEALSQVYSVLWVFGQLLDSLVMVFCLYGSRISGVGELEASGQKKKKILSPISVNKVLSDS